MKIIKCSQINDYTHKTGHDLITSYRTETGRELSAQKITSLPSKASVGFAREKERLNFEIHLKHREGFMLRDTFLIIGVFILRAYRM